MFNLSSFFRPNKTQAYKFEKSGYCPCCKTKIVFKSEHKWLRDHFLCPNCGSLPRERALITVIEKYYPDWTELTIHESSPGNRGISLKFKQNCPLYTSSQYFSDFPLGQLCNGTMNENLERLSFKDESFDIIITQDVVEHIFHPEKAFSEIARVLKPGGAHIFTVPLVNKNKPSEKWAELKPDGTVNFIKTPEYHNGPASAGGCPVTMHWGYDICNAIYKASGLSTAIFIIDNLDLGIRAEYIDVLVSHKPA